MSLQIRRFLCLLTLAASALGVYWSVRLGRADWLAGQATVPAASRSIELAPGISVYLRHAAEIRESEGLSASGLRERSAQINPLDSGNWIHLGLRSEMEGRNGDAEREFLQAFEVDRQFEPRWALANFYFRQGNAKRSLEWARKALEFGGGDLTAVFQLCWTVSGNAAEILDIAIPPRVEVLAQYLQFLDGSGRVAEASEVSQALLPLASSDQVPILIAHCSRSLEAGQTEAAMRVWNGLVGRGLIAGERVEPEGGSSSVDTGFQREMTGQGFEWGVQRADGVAVERLPDRHGVRIVFSRNEPEHYTILGQWIALASGKNYRFRVTYAASGMDAAGLKWVIYSPQTKAALMSAVVMKETSESHTIAARFMSPTGTQLARLELRYDREPGTVRPEGSIVFSHLTLEPAP
jgi:hypothetical protein